MQRELELMQEVSASNALATVALAVIATAIVGLFGMVIA